MCPVIALRALTPGSRCKSQPSSLRSSACEMGGGRGPRQSQQVTAPPHLSAQLRMQAGRGLEPHHAVKLAVQVPPGCRELPWLHLRRCRAGGWRREGRAPAVGPNCIGMAAISCLWRTRPTQLGRWGNSQPTLGAPMRLLQLQCTCGAQGSSSEATHGIQHPHCPAPPPPTADRNRSPARVMLSHVPVTRRAPPGRPPWRPARRR